MENKAIAGPEAIDFLDKLLRYDPAERLTAQVILLPFFLIIFFLLHVVNNIELEFFGPS